MALDPWNPRCLSCDCRCEHKDRDRAGATDSACARYRHAGSTIQEQGGTWRDLHVWIANGLHVDGKGLKIYGATDPNPWESGVQPLLEIGEFRFQTALGNLFRVPMNVDTIFVSGLTMNIPPKKEPQGDDQHAEAWREDEYYGRPLRVHRYQAHY